MVPWSREVRGMGSWLDGIASGFSRFTSTSLGKLTADLAMTGIKVGIGLGLTSLFMEQPKQAKAAKTELSHAPIAPISPISPMGPISPISSPVSSVPSAALLVGGAIAVLLLLKSK